MSGKRIYLCVLNFSLPLLSRAARGSCVSNFDVPTVATLTNDTNNCSCVHKVQCSTSALARIRSATIAQNA
eukprot:10654-Heterococcus_DN1.PRE.3